MPFKEVKRVVYKKNPLDKVICQLRFPPILKIDSQLPTEFQESIREDFPLFNETIELIHEVVGSTPSGLTPQMVQAVKRSSSIKNYQFTSEDGTWILNLTRTFIAMSCTDYQKWEDFKDFFQKPLETFIGIYNPPFLSRIGLRYIDILNRSILGLARLGMG